MTRSNSTTRTTKALVTAAAVVLAMTAAASAAEAPKASDALASGTLYSSTEAGLNCFFTNFGSTNVTVTAQEVFSTGSTTAIVTDPTCGNGTAVAPNQTCIIYPQSFSPEAGYSCKVTFSTAATNVRGALQLFDSSENAQGSTELR